VTYAQEVIAFLKRQRIEVQYDLVGRHLRMHTARPVPTLSTVLCLHGVSNGNSAALARLSALGSSAVLAFGWMTHWHEMPALYFPSPSENTPESASKSLS
jgi:hypothetical protein